MDMFRARIRKIVVLFIAAFAGMLLPIAVVVVLAFSGPPPYLLHEDRLGPEWAQAAPRKFPDGSYVAVRAHPDAPPRGKGPAPCSRPSRGPPPR